MILLSPDFSPVILQKEIVKCIYKNSFKDFRDFFLIFKI